MTSTRLYPAIFYRIAKRLSGLTPSMMRYRSCASLSTGQRTAFTGEVSVLLQRQLEGGLGAAPGELAAFWFEAAPGTTQLWLAVHRHEGVTGPVCSPLARLEF